MNKENEKKSEEKDSFNFDDSFDEVDEIIS